jgi:hypothetical protein
MQLWKVYAFLREERRLMQRVQSGASRLFVARRKDQDKRMSLLPPQEEVLLISGLSRGNPHQTKGN